MSESVLKFKGVSKQFPGVKALDNVSFELYEGEVLALIGENGAGKSTLVKCLTGAHAPTSGEIEVFGQTFKKIEPKQARDLGISAVYQEFNLAMDLPVSENVFMGNNPGNGFIVDAAEQVKRTQAIFDEFGVDIDPNADVRTLSLASMQIVEIAKATALNARILIMDEPTAPLTGKEVETLFRIVRNAKAKGVSIIYISHRLEEIFEICDRIVVMRDGQYEGTRMVKDTNRDELIRMMLGHDLTDYFPEKQVKTNPEVVLKAENLSGNGVRNVSFELHKGEVLGFAGLVGAGRTELMNLLFGSVRKDSGTITVNGKDYNPRSPLDAIKNGIALLPEDRKRLGLLMDKTIAVNITLANIKKYCHLGVIDKKREEEDVIRFKDRLKIKTPSIYNETQHLSGGNQQKVIVAKWLASDCKIIIFDEPTQGIDVGTKHEIYTIIEELVEEGCSVIVVSSEFEELMGIADHIVVMSEGELVGSLEQSEYNKQLLLDLASGRR